MKVLNYQFYQLNLYDKESLALNMFKSIFSNLFFNSYD